MLRRLAAVYQRAQDAQMRKAYDEATVHLREALSIELPPKLASLPSTIHYSIACNEALLGRKEPALRELALAIEGGYADFDAIAVDKDLIALRATPAYAAAIAGARENARRLRVFDVSKMDSVDVADAARHSFEDVDSPTLTALRTRYQLDAVVANAHSQLERQVALLKWVHDRWPHSGLSEPSHQDALTILREVEAGKRFRCVEYSVVLAQVFQAMGYPARVVRLRRDGMSFGTGKAHVVTEVWNDDLEKWIVTDGQNNATWQLDGKPLSAAEVRAERLGPRKAKLAFVRGPSKWMDRGDEAVERNVWVAYFEHLSFRFENVQPEGKDDRRWVDLVLPGERYELLFQGVRETNHLQTKELGTIYPSMNRVHLDLSAGASPETIDLRLSHAAPWFDHFRIEADGTTMETKTSSFAWKLQAGRNVVRVATVNRRGAVGLPTSVEVEYLAPAIVNGRR